MLDIIGLDSPELDGIDVAETGSNRTASEISLNMITPKATPKAISTVDLVCVSDTPRAKRKKVVSVLATFFVFLYANAFRNRIRLCHLKRSRRNSLNCSWKLWKKN